METIDVNGWDNLGGERCGRGRGETKMGRRRRRAKGMVRQTLRMRDKKVRNIDDTS